MAANAATNAGAGEPSIHFCAVAGGGKVAWASRGEGPPLVLVPGWLCHLEELWTHPAALSTRERLSRAHRFTWYDRLGCGLSDRSGFTPSLESDVAQLEAVLDAAGIERASLIGYSQGGPPAIAFAVRHPDRVERLVLVATFAEGRMGISDESAQATEELIRASWAMGSRLLASLFVPNGSAHDLRWFARFQRKAADAETAIALLRASRAVDVREFLAGIRVPTLVIHNTPDPAVPVASARTLASGIPGARLLLLEANEHEPFIRDSGILIDAILEFIDGRHPEPKPRAAAVAAALTPKERQVLRLIAEGESNKAIAGRLGIRLATVERHIVNIYSKIGARGRADAVLHAVATGLVPVPESRPQGSL